MRTALARMIASEPDLEVAGTACGANDAFEKIASLDPDVVTLDLAMPGMDGVGALRYIMTEFPRPVIVVSAMAEKDTDATFAAVSAGAFGFISKQLSAASLEIIHIRADLISKIRSAGNSRRSNLAATHVKKLSQSVSAWPHSSATATPTIVTIGVSTGGPRALEQILPRFPADLSVPILIVQHMPVGFTRSFAQRLNSLCSIEVREAAHRELVRPGVAYIAPAGVHMHVVARLSDSKPMLTLDRRPGSAEHIPSVDVLMKSVAQVFKNRAVGVIMTGMGSDGAEGMAAIFRQGGLTIGQDEATCAVYGMPRACADRGVLTRSVPLSDIPIHIVQAISRRRRPA
jgi:two-component system chemotaxis response regulator CheB